MSNGGDEGVTQARNVITPQRLELLERLTSRVWEKDFALEQVQEWVVFISEKTQPTL